MISVTHTPSTSGSRASISTNKPAGYIRWGSAIHQLSQPPATAGKARPDRPGRDAEAGGNRLVPLPFQPNQHHHRPVVCVKFSNLITVSGDAGGEPPASVAAVAAG